MLPFVLMFLITLFSAISAHFIPQHIIQNEKTLGAAISIPKPPSTFASPTPVQRAPTITPKPTNTATPTKTPPTPTKTPTPTSKPTNTPPPQTATTPTSITTQSTAVSQDEKSTYLLNAVNDFRASKGLPRASADSNTCNFATTRAGEITQNFNHDGFNQRLSNHTLPYPSFHEVTENISMNSDYRKVVPNWIASSGHAENMQKDTPYICIKSNGNYYAYEGWKP